MKLSRWLGVLSMMGEDSTPTKSLRELSGWAAVLGGFLWCVKGMAILLTGVQPPLLFEIGPLFFAINLSGLYAALNGRHSRLARTGIVVAFVLLMGLFGAISTVLGSDQLIEIPVVIVGLAWVGLGIVTLRYEPAMR